MKVSIIVPVYNTGKYLEKCLDSLINQTYQNIEIIIINDGSTDNSLEIIEKYQKKYHNIILINDTNHGQGHARNIGIENSTGNYIMFVDSDDYVNNRIIEELMNNINNCDVCVCDITKIIENKEVYFKNHYEYGNDRINLMLSHPGPVAKLYKKEAIKDTLFLENVYYEDLAFTPVVALNVNTVCYINKPLYNYLIHDNSTMQKKDFNEKIDSIFKVMDYLKSKLVDYPKELEFLYIEHLFYSASLRYTMYKEGKERLIKIHRIMKEHPNWKKNEYYQKKSWKFKLVCFLSSKKCYNLLKILNKLKGIR